MYEIKLQQVLAAWSLKQLNESLRVLVIVDTPEGIKLFGTEGVLIAKYFAKKLLKEIFGVELKKESQRKIGFVGEGDG